MSTARETFQHAIADAENLLRHFNDLNSHPPKPELEVLKRAGLVMALTAWETYVEDRLSEACEDRLAGLDDEWAAHFIRDKLAEEIKQLHSPGSAKTADLFRRYAGVDVTENWNWNPYDPKAIRKKLDTYIKLRGDVVHRARPLVSGPPQPHPVTKSDLEKAVRFFRNLVDSTEKGLPGASPLNCA